MNIVIASGKGGTGKTTVAVNLAYVASREGFKVSYVDADVDEPNGHIFLKPIINRSKPVELLMPEVNMDKCIGCGKCGEICQYGAIVYVGEKVEVFPRLCHGCGGCYLVCPTGAITEAPKKVGVIESGITSGDEPAGNFPFYQGILNIGEVSTTRVIDDLIDEIPDDTTLNFIDAAPGTSCPMVRVAQEADIVLLVTEPTPFGMSDLRLTIDIVKELKKPMLAFVNQYDIGQFNELQRYLQLQRVPISGKLPHSRGIAQLYSEGLLIGKQLDWVYKVFKELLDRVTSRIKG